MRSLIFAAVFLIAKAASAATVSLGSLVVTVTIVSTGGTCPLPANLVAPVAAGTVLCTFTIAPPGWQGVISNPTGGADSSKFVVQASGSASVLAVGSAPLTATGSAAGNATYQLGAVTTTP